MTPKELIDSFLKKEISACQFRDHVYYNKFPPPLMYHLLREEVRAAEDVQAKLMALLEECHMTGNLPEELDRRVCRATNGKI